MTTVAATIRTLQDDFKAVYGMEAQDQILSFMRGVPRFSEQDIISMKVAIGPRPRWFRPIRLMRWVLRMECIARIAEYCVPDFSQYSSKKSASPT